MDAQFTECTRVARAMVDPDLLASLRARRPKSVFIAIAMLWVQFILSWSMALFGPLWLIWLPFIINCAVTQAMLLWVHEASHVGLAVDQRHNDVLGDVFLAAPIGMTVAAYRARHMSHHAHLGTAQDLDGYSYRENIKGTRMLIAVLIRTLSGSVGVWLGIDKYIGGARKVPLSGVASPRWLAPLWTVAFNLLLFSACVAVGRWYLYILLWVYPILAVAIALNIVRTIAEHQPLDYPHDTNGERTAMRAIVRTTVPNWFEKWLMYQANFNYHVEHHLFPGIPQHNIALLHRHLVERGFYEQFPDCLQRSGFAKFIQISRRRADLNIADAVRDAVES